MKKTAKWEKDKEHMGHPTAYTNTTPAGYKEEITWEEIPPEYTKEEKAKIRQENYDKGLEWAPKAVHDKETTDHPVPKPGPEQYKTIIKKCNTKGCELSDEELEEKLKDKEKKERERELKEREEKDKAEKAAKKKAKEDKAKEEEEKDKAAAAKMQISAPAMFFTSENQDKLY